MHGVISPRPAGVAARASSTTDIWGSAIPHSSEPQFVAAQVLVISSALAEPTHLFLNRPVFNALRNEAGFGFADDTPGLSFTVSAGPAAAKWSIPLGSTVELTPLEPGVDVPRSQIAGDGWFTDGRALVSLR